MGAPGNPAERVVHRASFGGGYDVDATALVPDRAVAFDKASADTEIRVHYNELTRALYESGPGGCICGWNILFNGEACAVPGRLERVMGVYSGEAYHYGPMSVMGYCSATASGPIDPGVVQIEVESVVGGDPDNVCWCATGDGVRTGTLEAEELL